MSKTQEQLDAEAAEQARLDAERDAQQDKGTPEEQASISTTSDENGATKGYIGEDAADVIGKASDGEQLDRSAVRSALGAMPATYSEPVPPGGHPADPTSTTSVGAAADRTDKAETVQNL